jgi:glyoxylase-like metal-dependent hydrolase (beta-lactamase superfamily II)
MAGFFGQSLEWMNINGVPQEELSSWQNAMPGVGMTIPVAMPDRVLEGGDSLSTGVFEFEVIWTPGHAAGHIVLYEPEKRILIVGDHILPGITPNVGLYHDTPMNNPLGSYIASLKELRHLEVEIVLPGHEQPFSGTPGLRERIDYLCYHHELREAVILQALDNESKAAYAVASRLLWTVGDKEEKLDRLSFLDKWLALLETLAHLALLEAKGKVEKKTNEKLVLYHVAQ